MTLTRSLLAVFLISLFHCLAHLKSADALPAFPGAEGFGSEARGGRGGAVHEVTNLNNSGPGSLRAAVEASGPRTVVFRVSGTIRLESNLVIRSARITIAGQTAPGDGICLRDASLDIRASDVVVRFIRCRLGDVAGRDADSVVVSDGERIILDHVSASWGVDETLSVTTDENTLDRVTVQWCFITDALNDTEIKGSPHGYGSLIRGVRGS